MAMIEDLREDVQAIVDSGTLECLRDSTLAGTVLHDRLSAAAHELDAALEGLRAASPSSPGVGTQPGRTDRVPAPPPGEGQGRSSPPLLMIPPRAPRPLPRGAREDQ